jgi:hypothetical protein
MLGNAVPEQRKRKVQNMRTGKIDLFELHESKPFAFLVCK